MYKSQEILNLQHFLACFMLCKNLMTIIFLQQEIQNYFFWYIVYIVRVKCFNFVLNTFFCDLGVTITNTYLKSWPVALL